jgi:hypothetical protein
MARRDEIGHAAVPGHEHTQVGVQAVANTGCLGHEVLPCLQQQTQLARPIRPPDRWQVVFPGRHPRDREGIARIAIAGPMRPPPFGAAQMGRHLPDFEAIGLGAPNDDEPSMPIVPPGATERAHTIRVAS